ncbi:APH domain-containing protein [Mycena chlorophos]|uniref:APH domain-containing protein n=1 Tax=Mycena chlorophos TaxID=658473 RepID=A0A8H6TG66_MYCCL|nr:APH domain-containing protein [Mycena chlorophos]
MAIVHPDDEAFVKNDVLSTDAIRGLFTDRLGLSPTSITASTRQGSFHRVYFISLPQADHQDNPWSGMDVVLRVARPSITKIKTENEVAVLRLLREAGLPVPRVAFYSSDPSNPLGYEYDCIERVSYPSLADLWTSFTPAQFDSLLDQFVDIHIKLFELDVPRVYGSLALDGSAAPVFEETMWQAQDIKRYFHAEPYNLTAETFESLNPASYYASWPAYISAFLKTYHHVISIHPNVVFLRDLLEPLQALIAALDAGEIPWIRRLIDAPELRPRLFHKDFHFGNILADTDGTIHGIIDWEFAGLGASVAKHSPLINNLVGYLRWLHGEDQTAKRLVATWPAEFQARLEKRAPEIAKIWAREIDRDTVLGMEGNALSDLREFLRASLEVGVRGQQDVEKAKSTWKPVVEKSFKSLGF